MITVDTILEGLKQVLVVAAITEPVVEGIKLIYPKQLTDQQKQAASMTIGVIVAAGTGVTIFPGSIAQIVAGTVVAGLVAGRGANGIHSLIKLLQNIGDTFKVSKIK